jgi:hypothetical protein
MNQGKKALVGVLLALPLFLTGNLLAGEGSGAGPIPRPLPSDFSVIVPGTSEEYQGCLDLSSRNAQSALEKANSNLESVCAKAGYTHWAPSQSARATASIAAPAKTEVASYICTVRTFADCWN